MAGITRNQSCPCGSGARFKACCGGADRLVGGDEDGELLAMVLSADENGLAAGDPPKQRAFNIVMEVMRQLRPDGYVMAGRGALPEIERIQALIRQLYRPMDIAEGGIHLGAFMFRDVFARVSVPLGFGQFRLDPLDHVDLSPGQKAWVQRRPADYRMLVDQFLDLFDFGYGWMELGHARPVPDDCHTLIGLAHFQLQAAAATITSAYDLRGAVQSALLATELVLKAGLNASGVDADQLRVRFGHDHRKMAKALGEQDSRFDAERVGRVLDRFPAFVPNRYSPEQPARMEAGHIVMGAQYVASEVTRLLTDRDIRASGGAEQRSYPA